MCVCSIFVVICLYMFVCVFLFVCLFKVVNSCYVLFCGFNCVLCVFLHALNSLFTSLCLISCTGC